MLLDLTHIFGSAMPVFPGDPTPSLRQIATIAHNGSTDHELKTSMHIGTHIDAPLHMIEGAKRLSEIPPERFVGRGVLIDARTKESITADLLNNISLEPGDIVLLYTGHGAKFRDDGYFDRFPRITVDFAQALIDHHVSIVGLDTPSPDVPPFSIHKMLLGSGILIIENLTNLEALLVHPSFEVLALPMKLEADAGPVRVLARIMR